MGTTSKSSVVIFAFAACLVWGQVASSQSEPREPGTIEEVAEGSKPASVAPARLSASATVIRTPAADLAKPIPAASRIDTQLTNACILSGMRTRNCLCRTTILKHHLGGREYRAAAQLGLARYSGQTSLARVELIQEGFTPSEIAAVSTLSGVLTSDGGFAQRCEAAVAYFTPSLRVARR